MPVAKFQMADGRIARFEVPEGTTPEQAQTLISEHLKVSPPTPPTADTAAPAKPQEHGLVASALTGFGDMASFGFLDEAQGRFGALIEKARGVDKRPYGEIQKERTDAARKTSDEMWDQNPKAYGAGAALGVVGAPTLGTVKGASALAKVAPKLAGTPAKAAALVGAPLGALNAAGTADSNDNLMGDMATGAAIGAAGGAVVGKAVDLAVTPFITRWARDNKVSEAATKSVADRFASYTARDPDAAKIGPNATRVTNSVLKDLQTEIGAYLEKAKATGGVDAGDLKSAATIISKTGQKNAVHSTEDVALIHKVFGNDAPDVLHRIEQADTISTHMGSMKEIIGPVANGIEARNSSGSIMDLINAASLGALKRGNRALVQPWNPVNRLAKRGDASAVPNPQVVRDAITDAVRTAKVQKQATSQAAKALAGDSFNPASQSVIDDAAYGNPDILNNSVPPPMDYFPTSGISHEARRAIERVEAFRRMSDPKTQKVAMADGDFLPTVATDPSSVGQQVAKGATAPVKNRIKLNNSDLDFPVSSAEGWRGNARDQVFDRSGVEVTNGEMNRALADTLKDLAKRPGMNKAALKKLGAGANTPSNADRSVLAGVVRRLNATREPLSPSGASRSPTGSPMAVDGRGNPVRSIDHYESGIERVQSLQDRGFTFTNPSGNAREYLVTAPDGTVLGTVPDSATAIKLADRWKPKQ